MAEVVKEDNVFPMIPAGAAVSEMILEPPKTKLKGRKGCKGKGKGKGRGIDAAPPSFAPPGRSAQRCVAPSRGRSLNVFVNVCIYVCVYIYASA